MQSAEFSFARNQINLNAKYVKHLHPFSLNRVLEVEEQESCPGRLILSAPPSQTPDRMPPGSLADSDCAETFPPSLVNPIWAPPVGWGPCTYCKRLIPKWPSLETDKVIGKSNFVIDINCPCMSAIMDTWGFKIAHLRTKNQPLLSNRKHQLTQYSL